MPLLRSAARAIDAQQCNLALVLQQQASLGVAR